MGRTAPNSVPARRESRADTANPKAELGQRELIVLMASLMSLQAFGIDAMLPALGAMADDLAAGGNDRQYVISAYFLGSGIGAFFPGAFADRFGRRPVLFVGLISYVGFALACSLVSDFETLLVLRLLQGISCAGLSVVPTAIVRDRVSGDRMAKMMSLIIMIFLAVPIFAPAIGQLILMFFDWRAIRLGNQRARRDRRRAGRPSPAGRIEGGLHEASNTGGIARALPGGGEQGRGTREERGEEGTQKAPRGAGEVS